jgi:uncharacterized membrane protein (DUF2068 family)
MSKGLKTIACLKILRGAIAITIGISLYLVYRNSGVFSWIDHPELSSMASKDPFLQVLFFWLGNFNSEQIFSIAILASVMGILRWVEAGGIWFNKSWAQWLAVFSGFIYIPFEINELIYRFSWLMVLILIINTVVVTYLLYVLHTKRLAKLTTDIYHEA